MMLTSRTWLILTVVIVIAGLSVYALTSYNNLTIEEQALKNQQYTDSKIDALNKSLISGRAQQNVYRNMSLDSLLEIREALELLHNRTPLFEQILHNERLQIANQYQFAQQLNVTGVSNDSR